MRKFFVSAIAGLLAILFLTLFVTNNALAAASAYWEGDKISYEGATFEEKKGSTSNPGLVTGSRDYYVSIVTEVNTGNAQASIIYFVSGLNRSNATSAKFAVYPIDGSTGKFASSPTRGPTTIPIIPKSQSASSTQATWTAPATLSFDGRAYTGSGTEARIADGQNGLSIPNGTPYYQADVVMNDDGTGTVFIIYFKASDDLKTTTTATAASYAIDGGGRAGSQISSTTIDVVPYEKSPAANSSTNAATSTACNVDGIGWFVCPVSNFLATGMDTIFEMLKGFLMVEPISTNTDSPLYQAWNIMRAFANVAFVIAFLIIIYSQLTGAGIQNYGLKKLIPRLIVAAILVNLSYLICAIAVDASNVIGSGLQEMLVGIREGLNTPESKSVASWESVTGFILADVAVTGAAAVSIGGVILSSGASLGAALILLLPMLLGLILAVLVALIVLAARQAVIILLIIIAPLAFVAYLLPNTEKLFEKWRSLFITMLVFFPLFALVFGGSQLAAFLIIQSATEINVILLAMFVQVAPLVLTPLLVRFSGGLIGRIAGLVNDPKRGLIDRTRNWAREQSEYMAARNMARTDPVRRRQVFRRFALNADQMKRAQQERLGAYKEASDARWTNTQEYSDIQQQLRYAQDLKSDGTENATERYIRSKTVAGSAARTLDDRMRQTKQRVENAQSQVDYNWETNRNGAVVQARLQGRVLKDSINAAHSTHDKEYEEFKAGRIGHFPATSAVASMMRQVELDTRLMTMNALASESAKRAVNEQFLKDFQANRASSSIDGQLLQTYAGGVQGIAGAQRALASVISAESNAAAEAVKNAITILDDANLTESTVRQIALGNPASTGIVITKDIVKAALTKIGGGPNGDELTLLLRDFDVTADTDLTQTLSDAIAGNSNKPFWFGAGANGKFKQGIAPPMGKARVDQLVAEAINAGKLGAEKIVSVDRGDLVTVLATLTKNLSTTPITAQARATLKREIELVRRAPQYSGKIADRRDVIDQMYRML